VSVSQPERLSRGRDGGLEPRRTSRKPLSAVAGPWARVHATWLELELRTALSASEPDDRACAPGSRSSVWTVGAHRSTRARGEISNAVHHFVYASPRRPPFRLPTTGSRRATSPLSRLLSVLSRFVNACAPWASVAGPPRGPARTRWGHRVESSSCVSPLASLLTRARLRKLCQSVRDLVRSRVRHRRIHSAWVQK
jgi:hypothetical protein